MTIQNNSTQAGRANTSAVPTYLLSLLLLLYPGSRASGAMNIDGRIVLDDTIANSLRSDLSPNIINEQGLLGKLRLDVLTEKFVILPESPCKGAGELMKEATLQSGC